MTAIPDEDCLADAYRRALEQAFVQQKIDDVIDEAEKLGEDAEIPSGPRWRSDWIRIRRQPGMRLSRTSRCRKLMTMTLGMTNDRTPLRPPL